ncbi:putative type III effector protein with ppr repeats [Ralstonia pseudosolanacearum GMI1000]|uniref:Type III effector protein with ppr repeats n=1 Tax=Ralstonia nicotianae (strain ATCC BAA-1114 / GMI1000) TaxID=267608 RepID=Q8XTC0_RALN1|nr:putative type III effector protein with ppr repeats [Ralstonia pseudosolanacearum GMI1000]
MRASGPTSSPFHPEHEPMWRSNIGDQRVRHAPDAPDMQQQPASGQTSEPRPEGSRAVRASNEALAPLAANRWSVLGSASNAGFRRSTMPLPKRPEPADGGVDASSQVGDPRSNAAAIATYADEGCPADEVLKLTTSLLRIGGDFARSMALFAAVKDAGICPNVVTYSAAISACEKAGRMDEALVLLNELKAIGSDDPMMRPNVVTYSAAISACEKAGRADHAVALLGELKALAAHDPTMRPNVVTYSATISACEKAGWVDEALALLDELRALGQSDPALRPNVITYSAAISACMGAGQADRARWLVAQAIRDEVVLPDAGYDARANTLDFHANLVFREPAPSSRPVGVAAPVALALMSYHGHRGNLNGETHYIVGQHGGDAIKSAVLETLNRVRPRAYVVSPTNAGMLIATAPDPYAVWSAEDDLPPSPRAASSALPDALADRLRAMWPQAGASEALAAGQSDAMSIDDAEAMSSDEEDDGLIRFHADPAARAAQLRDLKARVREAATAEDVLALVEAAGRLRAEAAERYPGASAEQLKDAFLPGSENVDSNFRRLNDMRLDCDDAAQAWQAASDHYRSARDAALKLNLPGDFVTPLETAEAECEAQATRLEITHGLLDGIWRFKGWRQSFDAGHPKSLDVVLKPLQRALALGNAEALATLPFCDVPIQAEFHDQLNIIHGDAAQLVSAGGGVLPLALLNRLRPEAQAARRAMSAAASAEIVKAIALLGPALKGEMPAAAPEPMLIDEPGVSERAVSVALTELIAHLTPGIESARRVAALAQSHETGALSVGDQVRAFGLWHRTVEVFGRARQAFEAVAASGWPSEALSAPDVQALHAEIRQGYDAAVGKMQATAGRVFAAMWEQVRGSLGQVRDAQTVAQLMARMHVPDELGIHVADGCQHMRSCVEDAPVALRAGGIDAARMVAPFTALQAFLRITRQPLAQPEQLLPTAAHLLQVVTLAKEAGAGAASALKPALHAFSTFCADLRMQLVHTAHRIERREVSTLCTSVSPDIWAAATRVEHRLRALVDPKAVTGQGITSAGTAEEPSDAAMAAAADMAALRLEQRREGLLALPPGVPATLTRKQARSALLLRGIAAAGRLTAELIRCHERAAPAMGEANLAQRAKALGKIAAEVQAAGAKAGEAFVDTVTLGDAPESASPNSEAALLSAAVSRCEFLAEYMRFCVQTLADLAAGRRNAQSRIRQPAGDASAYVREADAIQGIHDDIVDRLYEACERVVGLIEAKPAIGDTREAIDAETNFVHELVDSLEWRAIVETDMTQRAWMRATLDVAAVSIDHASRDVLQGMSTMLAKIEDDLRESKGRLVRYAEKTGDQAYRASLKLEDVTLGVGVARAQTRLIDRLNALAGASRAQPSKSKGKGTKGKGKAK